MKRRLALLLAVSCTGSVVLAGEVQSRAGKTLQGQVSIDSAGLVVTAGSSNSTVPFADVVYAKLDSTAPTTQPVVEANGATLPAGWTSNDVGPVKQKGSAKFADGIFRIEGSGWGLWSGVDSFHYSYRTLEGDGQIIAHVTPIEGNAVPMTAGVLIRDSLDPQANMAGAILESTGQVRLKARPRPEQEPPLNYTIQVGEAGWTVPKNPTGWVRLTRSGKNFTAYQSNDGKFWERVGAKEIDLSPKVMIGLAVATSGNEVAAPTNFDSVRVIEGSPERVPLNPAPTPASGIVLADGVSVNGQITAIGRGNVVLRDQDGKDSIHSIDQVAWAIFKPAPADLSTVIPNGGQGALLLSGDFFEGEIVSLADGKVTVNSILLGPKSFDVTNEILALTYRSPANWDRFRVKLKSDAVIAAPELTLEGGKLKIGDRQEDLANVAEIFGPVGK